MKNPDDNDLDDPLRSRAVGAHSISLNWGPEFAERFTADEAVVLNQRFATLDSKLQADEEHFVPGFQSGPMRYFFEVMDEDFGVGDFIASWNE